MDAVINDSLLTPASYLTFLLFNVIFMISSLVACSKKKPPQEPAAPAAPPADAADNKEAAKPAEATAKVEEKKEKSKKEEGSKKKSAKEQKSKKEVSKKEKVKKSEKKDVKEDGEKKEGELEKAEENKDSEKKNDEKEEDKKLEEGEKKDGEKKDEEKKEGEAAPGTSPIGQTAIQLIKKEVVLEPTELRFGQNGGETKLNVTNNTGSRIAVKVKCSDNNLFRVNPVFSFIEKDDKCVVEVSRTTGNPKPDKLVILTTEVADDAKDAPAIFKDLPADKMTTVNVAIHVN